MITALKQMLASIESWPEEDQEALTEAAREIAAARTGVYDPTPREEAAIAEGLTQANRGEFASEEEISALWKRYGA
jgi:predicted transcriptional regulator